MIGPLAPGAARELLWYSIVRRFAFWRGVRRNVDRAEWAGLTQVVEDLSTFEAIALFATVLAETLL